MIPDPLPHSPLQLRTSIDRLQVGTQGLSLDARVQECAAQVRQAGRALPEELPLKVGIP